MIAPGQPVSGRDVARHYDVLDALYRDVWGEHLHHGLFSHRSERVEAAVVNLIDHLVEHLDISPSSSVCDVGCGYGATATYLADRLGCDVHGITISSRQYERASSRGHTIRGRIHLAQDDWLAHPYRDSEFDYVIAVESLAHFEDKPAFFRQAARVLRPGGRLGICAWLAPPSLSAGNRRFLLEPICREGRLPSIGTMEEYVFMMRRAGLDPLLMEDLTHRVRRTWTIIARRVVGKLMTRRDYRRLMMDPNFEGRVFGLTIMRLLIAYQVNAMRYGMLIAAKPAVSPAA